MLDTVIRGGTVIDGTGSSAFVADIGIRQGQIVEIGTVTTEAAQTIDARGALVTPGFIDIHTHYDGQASWDETFSPSIYHGVTTVVMGNCGVGFAPVHKGEEVRLLQLMEGVEEIPGAVLAEGVKWGWTSFTEYARALDNMPHSLDFLTLVPHDCLRLFVMGDRASRREAATEDDRTQMAALLREALEDGAIGFSTGRTDNHRTTLGEKTPASIADQAELRALASAFQGLPYRILHAVSDFDCNGGPPAEQKQRFEVEYALLEELAKTSGRTLALTWLERFNAPQQAQWLAEAAERSKGQGLSVRLQTACRAIGVLNGLDTSFNVLMAFPTYQAIADLPRAERAARLRDPAIKAQVLSEKPSRLARDGSSIPPLADQILAQLESTSRLMFPFGPMGKEQAQLESEAQLPPNYEPDPRTSFAARAAARGLSGNAGAFEVLYDYLAEGEGDHLIYFPLFNYLRGSLETVRGMLQHPQALLALSDAGAHVGTVCDASLPTSLLTHWVRDRSRGERLPLEYAVSMLTSRNAAHLGLTDRGVLQVGARADINVLDFEQLQALAPALVNDLPAGGKRFVQKAKGYRATLVKGEIVCENGQITDARPGRWVRA